MNLINLNKLNAKKKIIISSIVFVFFIFLVVYFIGLSSINEINDIKKYIIEKKIEIINYLKQEENSDSIIKKINDVRPEIEKTQKYYINKNDELAFITTLEKIATDHNILQKINIQFPETQKETEESILLELNALGTYKNILEYLSAIESSEYFISVKELEFTKQGSIGSAVLRIDQEQDQNQNKNEEKKITLKIKAEVYYK